MNQDTRTYFRFLALLLSLFFSVPMHAQGGYTLDFDGTDEYVEATYDANLNPANFTLEAWVKVEGGAGNFRSVMTSRQVSNTGGYMIYAGSDNIWQFWTGNNTVGSWNSQSSGVAVSSEWTHLACSYDGTTKSIYINGVLAISSVESYTQNTSRPLRIGAGATEATPEFYFPGKIDEVRIWSDVRTQAEIQADMHKELAGSEGNLEAYYQMSNGSGTSLTDNSTNSYTGTLINAPVWKTSGALVGSGMALNFDGTDDEVHSTITMTPTDTFTLEAWLYFESLTGKQSPLDFQQAISGAQITVNKENATNQLTISIDDGTSTTTMYTTAIIAANQWYHLAIVYIENQVLLYVNGAQIMNGSTVLSYRTTANNDFYLGASDGSSHSDAIIDEVRIWDDIRSQTEILSGMFRTLEGDETNLVAYYRFDQQPAAGNTTLYDYSENGQDGTLSGMDATTDWVSSTPFNTWIGSESSDWSNGDNWSSGSVPSTEDVGVYGWAGSNSPASGNISARNLYVHTDASVSHSGNLSLSGNYFNVGTFSSTGSLTLSGSSMQFIAGASPSTFGALTVNNGAGVALAQGLTVSNTLTLTNGLLTLNGQTLTLGNSATIGGTPGVSNHINATSGTLRKSYSGTGSFAFPVGDGSNYSPITLNFTSGSFSSAYADVNLTQAKHDENVSTGHFLSRYWTVSSSGISAFSCDVSATYVNGDITGTESELHGGKWDGSAWIDLGSVTPASNLITGTVSSFSDFTGGQPYAFPVEWLNFSAKPEANSVLLDWTTASEQNSDFFAIERSGNLEQWEELGTQAAAGNSTSQLDYQYEDPLPLPGTAWYRLRQVDLDGSFQYSSTIAIHFAGAGIVVYPNPVKDHLTIEVPSGQQLDLELINLQGQRIWQQQLDEGTQQLSLSDLPSGLYTLRMRNEQHGESTYQIVKQ